MRTPRLVAMFVVLVAVAPPCAAGEGRPSPEVVEFFEAKVRPVLAENCYSCHGPKRQQGGLRLDSRGDLLKGSDTGPVVLPGAPEKSPLVRALAHDGEIKMPPRGKLAPEAVAALTEWVTLGAPWPEAAAAPAGGATQAAAASTKHWAFQPVRKPALPAVKNAAWAKNPIDLFIIAKLEAKGLPPAPPAERRALLRRVTFDLTGLPPSPDEVEAFVRDPSPDALATVVDRLLASPRYGERWGRHWLDVARYADTRGYVFNAERRFAASYTYRDYVIRAFNEDLPYDRFLIEQIAADRLPLGDDRRPLAAMGFLTLGRRFLNNPNDIIDDRLDVVFRGLQGLTIGCARCHDHKYDPIPMRDYYSLHGVLASSIEPRELPVLTTPEPSPEYQAYEAELKKLQQAVGDFEKVHEKELAARNRKFRDELRALQRKVDQLRVTHPGSPPQAMVLVDAPAPVQPVVFLRGNPNNRGEAVPRQFLGVLSGDKRQPFQEGSGRLEMARAIASKDNPLTARVMVNRLWLHHFGQGLVRTPGDFGSRGEPPTHPQLLDWLAATFMENGWSVKKMHRLIVLSAAYQQSSTVRPQALAVDPDNRLWSHAGRRRLDFESLRDSLLAAAGRLDTRSGGPGVELTTAPFATRRAVYGFIDRQNLPGVFRTFDFASPDSSTPQRHNTTVPQQALYLMNSPFVVEQARHLAARPDVVARATKEERIDYLYRILYGRPSDADEVTMGCQFLDAAATGSGLSAWEKYAQVLLLANEFAFVD